MKAAVNAVSNELDSKPCGAGQRIPSVMIVAGEASSDLHAASLARALRARHSDVRIFGMGGAHLRDAGVETIVDSETEASVMGITEVLGSLGKLYRAFRALVVAAKKRRPDVVVLVDFPDFNLLLARLLKRLHVKVFYYVSPQLWAWRRGRMKTMRRYVDEVAVIFPFEEEFYRGSGMKATFVGHPFVDREPVSARRREFLAQFNIDPERPVIALLPGSRKAELNSLLLPMLRAVDRVSLVRPGIQAVVPVAGTLSFEQVEEFVAEHAPVNANVRVIEQQARELMTFSDAAIVASGTATVEAALAGVPFFVVYKLAPLTYRLAKLLVRGIKNFAMVNLIAAKPFVTELLQDQVTPERLAEELERILGDKAYAASLRSKLLDLRDSLKHGGGEVPAAQRAADLVLGCIGEEFK